MSDTSQKTKDEETFVEMFKREHNEQFYVLVKMHLSFLLHMTTEESECFYEKVKLRRWNLVSFTKKSKHKQDGAVLDAFILNQLDQLINYLKQNENLAAEGIFRRTGSVERQNELKTLLLQGTTIDFDEHSFTVHDCASVLKGVLADFPEAVTTDIQFPLYCQIAESFRSNEPIQESKILQTVQLLFLLLPKENKNLLRNIFDLLHLVTLRETSNRMSSENLAKLFTPHLLCPRKLAPENLLKNSQMLFTTVAFMIRNSSKLFNIPAQLMLDFRTHHEQGCVLNESVKGAAHTVFTFVDNKLTAKENEENTTDAALAELYAHIQSLPESSKKRKLVKQFNKQNGHGTPLQVIRSSATKNKSLGDSIKKHMFHKKLLKNIKRSGFSNLKASSSDETLNSPHLHQKSSSRARLFCYNSENSSDEDVPTKKKRASDRSQVKRTKSKSDSDLSLCDVSRSSGQYLTSTPACIFKETDIFTPEGQGRKSMSPITRSAQRMSRAMQETMMTPRSRKPVLLVSGTNINNLAKVSPTLAHLQEEDNSSISNTPISEAKTNNKLSVKSKSDGALRNAQSSACTKLNKTDSPECLSTTFQHYLTSRDMQTFSSPTDSTFSSQSDDFRSFNSCQGEMTDSMLYVLDGNDPLDSAGEKKLVLKPRQFDENGKPIVFETSF